MEQNKYNKEQSITFKIEKDDREMLKKKAAVKRLPLSSYVRLLLSDYLNRREVAS